MGRSSWSDDFYNTRAASRAKSGASAFVHTDSIRSGTTDAKTHDDLNPKNVIRESRDSDEHPESNAVGVIFDVTGSMGHIPVELQKKLTSLMGLLVKKGYIEHPQLLFGAVGDYRARDSSPLQIGQFESGNEMEDVLEKIYIESGGGGNTGESYDLAMYFFARKTSIDCFEKRGNKGYLFTIGDEPFFDTIKKADVEAVIGDVLQDDIPIKDIVAELQEKYHYFHIIPKGGYRANDSEKYWRDLLGQDALILDNPDAVCETIALTVGLREDTIDLDSGVADISSMGVADSVIASASKTVAVVGGKDIITSGILPEALDGGSSVRL